jgi:hypothetical protein
MGAFLSSFVEVATYAAQYGYTTTSRDLKHKRGVFSRFPQALSGHQRLCPLHSPATFRARHTLRYVAVLPQ